MTDTPVVSVIMLVYNQKSTFARAIDSVLAQKCDFPYEILVGDDASTDGTDALAREYARRYPNVRVFIREENLGVTRNAYELLKSANGEFIASCEGDDFWCDPQKLQIQVDFLRTHPDYAGCSHDIYLVNREGKVYSNGNPDWVSKHREYSYRNFKGIYLPGQSGTIVKRNYFRDEDCSILYEASSSIGDRSTVLLCLPHGKFYRMPRRMACYTLALDAKSQSVTANQYEKNSRVLRREWEYTDKLERYTRERMHASISFEHYKHGLFLSALVANLRNGSKKDPALPGDIWKEAKNKPTYVLAMLPWLWVKVWRKCKKAVLKRKYAGSIRQVNEKA